MVIGVKIAGASKTNILSAVYDFDDSVNNNFCEEFNFDNHS